MKHLFWILLTSLLGLLGFLFLTPAAGGQLTWRDPAHPLLEPRPVPRPPLDFVRPPPPRMNVRVEVVVHGRVLPTVSYRGRTYLPVPRLGEEYVLRVWNHGPRRISANLSVDGLSVINGRPQSDANPGYIVAPYTHVDIPGWRRDLEMVAAFRFVDRSESYAARMGRYENVGTIHVTAYEEQTPVRPWPPLDRSVRAPQRGESIRAYGEVGSIGTEYGRDVHAPTWYVPFVRSANRREITIHYDTVEALRAQGIPVDRPYPLPAEQEFAPPPPR